MTTNPGPVHESVRRLTPQQFADNLIEYAERHRAKPFESWQEAVRELICIAFEDARSDAMRVLNTDGPSDG